MYDRTLAIYCFIDDLFKALYHCEYAQCEISDSEVLICALVAILCFGGNFESSRTFLHSSSMMPRMLSLSRLSRRLGSSTSWLKLFFTNLD